MTSQPSLPAITTDDVEPVEAAAGAGEEDEVPRGVEGLRFIEGDMAGVEPLIGYSKFTEGEQPRGGDIGSNVVEEFDGVVGSGSAGSRNLNAYALLKESRENSTDQIIRYEPDPRGAASCLDKSSSNPMVAVAQHIEEAVSGIAGGCGQLGSPTQSAAVRGVGVCLPGAGRGAGDSP